MDDFSDLVLRQGSIRHPQAYLSDVLAQLPGYPAKRVAELLPWNGKPAAANLAA